MESDTLNTDAIINKLKRMCIHYVNGKCDRFKAHIAYQFDSGKVINELCMNKCNPYTCEPDNEY